MKPLTVNEATAGLGKWLEMALAGEEIQIRTGDALVALRPTAAAQPTPAKESLAPREALRRLQQDARLATAAAENYLREVREQRVDSEDRRPT